MRRWHSVGTWIAALATAFACGTGWTGTQTTDPNQVFAELERLGACNVAGAGYVRLAAGRWSPADMLPYDYSPSGNAWMRSETRDAEGRRLKGTFIVEGGDLVEVHWSEGPPSDKDDPFRVYGTWSPALCRADTLLVMQSLRDAGAGSLARMGLQRGHLLLFALQLHQQGSRDAAGRLVEGLCRVGGGRDATLAAGMSVLADAQYRRLYRRFLAEHDWATYSEGIKELVPRYSQGWKSAVALQMLLDRIAMRLSGSPSVPADANGLSEADLRLAGRLTSLRSVRPRPLYRDPPVLWLIPASWPAEVAREGNTDLEIRARGIAGLPLLLALCNDGALTEVDAHTVRDKSFLPRIGWDSGYSFDTLYRPATRGEVAERILLDILPSHVTQGNVRPKSGKDLFDTARTFYEKHRNATNEELAALFLPGLYGGLNDAAMTFLLKIAAGRRVPALEEFLLRQAQHPGDDGVDWAETRASKMGELLVRYAALRGADVRPLVAQVTAALRTSAGLLQKPDKTGPGALADERRLEQIRTRIRRVADDVEAVPFESSLEDLLTQQRWQKGRYRWTLLTARLEAMVPADAIAAVLRTAVETKDPTSRAATANVLGQVLREKSIRAGTAPARNKPGVDPALCADLWRTLIADDRVAGEDASYLVSDRFLCEYERLFAGRRPGEAQRLIQDSGAAGRELLRKRVLGRLSGTPEAGLPKYPQDAPLSSTDIASLKGRLAAVASREQAAGLVGKLPIDEQAALPELLRSDPALNTRLIAMANTLTGVSDAIKDATFQNRLAAWIGRPVTADLVREIWDYCRTKGQAGQEALCLVARKEHFGGCEITIRPGVEGQGPESQHIKGIAGLACAPGVYGAAVWRLAPLPEQPGWRTFVTSDPDTVRDFERALAEALGPGVEASAAALIKFQTKGGVE